MKYTARDRALAIRICQIAAMTPGCRDAHGHVADGLGIARRTDVDVPGVQLAVSAWARALTKSSHDPGLGLLDAEAECLLREGWSPGDKVYRRKS